MAPARQEVAHDSAVKLFQWRGRTSKREFRRRFIELMHDAAPHVKYLPSAQDELDLTAKGR